MLALARQYLVFVEEAQAVRLELAADYLVMAAWLAFLKSVLLLPREPRWTPIRRSSRVAWERLDAMREAGARLMARDRIGRDVFLRAAPEGLRAVRQPKWHATIYDLIAAYGRVSARTRPVMHVVADREVMTLEFALERVAALLGTRLDWAELASFLPSGSDRLRKSALASSFLAALELAKQGRVELRQEAAFAPLYLRPA